MSTLEYYKIILDKVSFDESLLKKELGKAVKSTKCEDQPELLKWCRSHLEIQYAELAATLMKDKGCAY